MKEIFTDKAPSGTSPLSQGMCVGNFLFVSGQIPRRPDTGELVTGDFAAEVRQVFHNVQAILEAGGASLRQVCKVNAYLTDTSLFEEFNRLYSEFFEHRPLPARTTIGCMLARTGIRVEVEAIAYLE